MEEIFGGDGAKGKDAILEVAFNWLGDRIAVLRLTANGPNPQNKFKTEVQIWAKPAKSSNSASTQEWS